MAISSADPCSTKRRQRTSRQRADKRLSRRTTSTFALTSREGSASDSGTDSVGRWRRDQSMQALRVVRTSHAPSSAMVW